MKRIVIFGLLLIFYSCSSDDNNVEESQNEPTTLELLEGTWQLVAIQDVPINQAVEDVPLDYNVNEGTIEIVLDATNNDVDGFIDFFGASRLGNETDYVRSGFEILVRLDESDPYDQAFINRFDLQVTDFHLFLLRYAWEFGHCYIKEVSSNKLVLVHPQVFHQVIVYYERID
jgi:hypothetical protein